MYSLMFMYTLTHKTDNICVELPHNKIYIMVNNISLRIFNVIDVIIDKTK